jgi:Ni,Fe-hydrogenase III small subunit
MAAGSLRGIARRLRQRPADLAAPEEVDDVAAQIAQRNRGSLQLRQVDAGSCNGCELEIASCFSPAYDAERFGIRLEASPRHADGLLVTGPVTHNMADPLRKTYDAVPEPKIVVAVGDCARDCGLFRGAYGVAGAVSDVLPVDLEIPGCPPEPDAIIIALRSLSGR